MERAELPDCSLPGNGSPWSAGRASLLGTFKSSQERFDYIFSTSSSSALVFTALTSSAPWKEKNILSVSTDSLLPHDIYSFSVLILYFVRRVSDTSCSGSSVLGCVLQTLSKYCPLFSRVADLVMRAPFALHCLLEDLLAYSGSICPLTML